MKEQPLQSAPRTLPGSRANHACDELVVVGIDVGGTHTKMGVFTLDGEPLGISAFDSQRVLVAGSAALFAREVGTMLERAGVDAGCVAAVGLAVPGAVSGTESLDMCPNINLDLQFCKALLRAQFPHARMAVLNDADAAVLGDCWCGSARELGAGNIVLVTLGTGVGAGYVFRGALYGSVHGSAGEVGHLCVNPSEQEPCSCGRAGCLEQYASAKGLVRTARQEQSARAQQVRQHTNETTGAAAHAPNEAFPDARSVLEAFERRDPAACMALNRFSDALGFGLSQIACLVDPDVFVLGGGLSERADLFLDAVRARYRAGALPLCRDTPIVSSKLGNKCGVYGAAYRAHHVLDGDEGDAICGCFRW